MCYHEVQLDWEQADISPANTSKAQQLPPNPSGWINGPKGRRKGAGFWGERSLFNLVFLMPYNSLKPRVYPQLWHISAITPRKNKKRLKPFVKVWASKTLFPHRKHEEVGVTSCCRVWSLLRGARMAPDSEENSSGCYFPWTLTNVFVFFGSLTKMFYIMDHICLINNRRNKEKLKLPTRRQVDYIPTN